MRTSLFIIYLAVLVAQVFSLPCNNNLSPARVFASTNQDGYPPTKAIDNDLNAESRWSAKGEGVWITFDLGSDQSVCSAAVAWWQANARQFNYVISVSSDNVSYKEVKRGQSLIGADTLQTYGFAQVNARYVRLTVNANTVSTWASVIEMRVTGLGFIHPGVLVKQSQLDFIKGKIQAGQQPWKKVFDSLKNNARFGNLNFVASPTASIKCGSGSYTKANPTDPNVKPCENSRFEGQTIWGLTLLWKHTGDQRYATTAIKAINTWVNTLKKIEFNGASDASASNGPLQAAWMSEMWVRSAELLRHGNSGWASADAAKFGTWMMNVFYPHIQNGWYGGNNWDLSMMDGLISIAVYNDNITLFNSALSLWKSHIPQYIYMTSDGPKPIVVRGSSNVDASWSYPNKYFDGLAQETCRDLAHTQMGFAAMINFAETAWIQGHPEIYQFHENRIVLSHEIHASYVSKGSTTVSSDVCGGTLDLVGYWPTWEIFYNHYRYRAGKSLPNTASVVNTIRNSGPYHTNLHSAWETLTHCEVQGI